ncbi:MAG: hypothetical protein ACE5GU_14890 [Candidatus Scalinduaceae bacterium]
MPTINKTLWVCWKKPEILPGNNAVILSFLSPGKEEELKEKFNGNLISARQVAPQIREKALKVYTSLIAKTAATPLKGGKTLRQALKNKEGVSLWWFNYIPAKNCEHDMTFKFIIEIFIIISVSSLVKNKQIVFFGGYKELASALRGRYAIREIQCRSKYNYSFLFIRGVLSRIKYSLTFLVRWSVVKATVRMPQFLPDVIFSGFWDWSVKGNELSGYDDRFFKSLPDKLSSRGLRVGWFLWFAPHQIPASRRHKLKEVLEPVRRCNDVVILQHLLKITDLMWAISNYKPYIVFLRFCRKKEFRKVFVKEGVNYFDLLKKQMAYSFLSSTIPNCELVYRSSTKAFRRYNPKLSISFQELFMYSRAFYAGGKQGSPSVIHCAVQHASYSREKTMAVLDPEIEYRGHPDNCPTPKPDYIFAMGEIGREIFMESGFQEERVFLTGSSRYEHITNHTIVRDGKGSRTRNLLLVTSLDRDSEMEMIEAVYEATKCFTQLRLSLRSHPFAKMEEIPGFKRYEDRILVKDRALEEDIKEADLIIFSYSTVAEEALIKGVPVWQWVSASYDASVFRELKVVPSFCTISDLRESLKRFISNPNPFIPDEKTRSLTLRKCFFLADGGSSERIADILSSKL